MAVAVHGVSSGLPKAPRLTAMPNAVAPHLLVLRMLVAKLLDLYNIPR